MTGGLACREGVLYAARRQSGGETEVGGGENRERVAGFGLRREARSQLAPFPRKQCMHVAKQPKLPRRAAARAGEGKLRNCTHSLVFLHFFFENSSFFFLLNVFALLSRHSIVFLIVRYCSLCPKKNVNLIS